MTGSAPIARDLYWRIFQRVKQKAVRSGDLKYLVTAEGEFLFDLAGDPGEKTDLKAQRGDQLAKLKSKCCTTTMSTPRLCKICILSLCARII